MECCAREAEKNSSDFNGVERLVGITNIENRVMGLRVRMGWRQVLDIAWSTCIQMDVFVNLDTKEGMQLYSQGALGMISSGANRF